MRNKKFFKQSFSYQKFKKKFFSFFKFFLYFVVDFLANLFFILKKYKIEKADEILITRIDNLGDFVVSVNILREFRQKFKDEKMVFLCNDMIVDLAKKTNYFDEVISIKAKKMFFGDNILELDLSLKNFFYRIKTLLELKHKKYKKIIHLNNKYTTSFLLKNFEADEKIGMFDKSGNQKLNKFISNFYDKYIEIPEKNELKKLVYFFNEIFDENIKATLPEIDFDLPKYKFENKIENYCIFGLGASVNEKTFDVENFVEIAKNKEILDINNSEKSLKIILLGTENEKFLGENFLKKFGNYDGKIVNLIGKTNVLEVFSIIKYAQFVLGHDSAYIHIATALKIPSICLLSGHNFGDFLPYEIDEKKTDQILPVCVTSKMDCFGCGVICKLGLTENMKYPCVENIDTDEINQAIFQVLSTN